MTTTEETRRLERAAFAACAAPEASRGAILSHPGDDDPARGARVLEAEALALAGDAVPLREMEGVLP